MSDSDRLPEAAEKALERFWHWRVIAREQLVEEWLKLSVDDWTEVDAWCEKQIAKGGQFAEDLKRVAGEINYEIGRQSEENNRLIADVMGAIARYRSDGATDDVVCRLVSREFPDLPLCDFNEARDGADEIAKISIRDEIAEIDADLARPDFPDFMRKARLSVRHELECDLGRYS